MLKQIRSRRSALAALKTKGQVEPSDIGNADQLLRFAIADNLWSICAVATQQALLNDDSFSVRSAAYVAMRLSGGTPLNVSDDEHAA